MTAPSCRFEEHPDVCYGIVLRDYTVSCMSVMFLPLPHLLSILLFAVADPTYCITFEW